jgi:hypothetical protein
MDMNVVSVVFSIWLVWNVLPLLFTTPPWFPYALAVTLGTGAMLLIDPGHWWWGVGIAGIAHHLLLVTDLILVTTDTLRSKVVNNARRVR